MAIPVYQLGNRWYVKKQINGVRVNRALEGAKNEDEAIIAAALLIKQIKEGEIDITKKKDKMLFGELVLRYAEKAEGEKLGWSVEKHKVKRINEHFKKYRIDKITLDDIYSFRKKLKTYQNKKGEPVSDSTLNRYISILSAMMNYAVDSKLIKDNPCRCVKKLRENTPKPKTLKPNEEKILFDLFTNKSAHLLPIVVCALHTGARLSEILNLKWENIDLDKRMMYIIRTKNGEPRDIPISITLQRHFNQLRQNSITEFIFVNPKTKQPYKTIYGAYKRACKKAGIEGLKFHELRHTAGTRMIEKVDIRTVQEILGHQSVITTQRYVGVTDERKFKAIDALDTYLEDEKNTKNK